MKYNSHRRNLASIKLPKINTQIECPHHFQNNFSFAMANFKSLYSSKKYVVKTISMLSNIVKSVLLAICEVTESRENCENLNEWNNPVVSYFYRI